MLPPQLCLSDTQYSVSLLVTLTYLPITAKLKLFYLVHQTLQCFILKHLVLHPHVSKLQKSFCFHGFIEVSNVFENHC